MSTATPTVERPRIDRPTPPPLVHISCRCIHLGRHKRTACGLDTANLCRAEGPQVQVTCVVCAELVYLHGEPLPWREP